MIKIKFPMICMLSMIFINLYGSVIGQNSKQCVLVTSFMDMLMSYYTHGMAGFNIAFYVSTRHFDHF